MIVLLSVIVWPDLHPDLDQRPEVGMPHDCVLVLLLSVALRTGERNLLDLRLAIWKIFASTIRADFLRWTALSLQRDWCNLRLCLYVYSPSWKYCIAHSRAFAACVLSSDEALDDAWRCWACYVPTAGKEGALS